MVNLFTAFLQFPRKKIDFHGFLWPKISIIKVF